MELSEGANARRRHWLALRAGKSGRFGVRGPKTAGEVPQLILLSQSQGYGF
jgi:hypothetical protein